MRKQIFNTDNLDFRNKIYAFKDNNININILTYKHEEGAFDKAYVGFIGFSHINTFCQSNISYAYEIEKEPQFSKFHEWRNKLDQQMTDCIKLALMDRQEIFEYDSFSEIFKED